MDKFIDARFDRVEKALGTLIDSIAKYNPSPALAEDLLAADRELSGGLEKLQAHQNNHLRILALRADVAALDSQIKSTIQTLAASRRDILQTPATVFPEDNTNRTIRNETKHYPFTYDELMSYARRISRNTVPAPGQTDGSEFFGSFGPFATSGNGADASAPGTAAPTPVASTPGPGTATNGAGTPAAGGSFVGSAAGQAAAAATAPATAVATPTPYGGAQAPANVPDVLPQDLQRYIAPTTGTVFSPWPTPELMLDGALRTLHTVTETATGGRYRGQPPAQLPSTPPVHIRFVSLEEQEEEERQRAVREAEEREEREERQRRQAEAAAASVRPVGGAGGRGYAPSAAPAPTQFASALDMDDDDD